MNKLMPKQEKFCFSYVETGNASEAYRRVYNATKMKSEMIWRKSKELLDNGKVAARIEVLMAEHRKRHDVTIDSLTAELEKARELEMADLKGASAAVSAIMGKAKLHGLILDKPECTNKGDNTKPVKPDLSIYTLEELRQFRDINENANKRSAARVNGNRRTLSSPNAG